MRTTNYSWYIAPIFLVLIGIMQSCCNIFDNCCEEDEIVKCFAPHNFKISDIAYLSEAAEVTLSWEERENTDSYTVLYLEDGVLNETFSITTNTAKFMVDTTVLEHSFEIFSNCSNCDNEAFVSDTVAIGIEGFLIKECPMPTSFDAEYDGESLTITFDAIGSEYPFTEYTLQVKKLGTTIEDLQIVPHPDNSATFEIPTPIDDTTSELFEVGIYQSCNPFSSKLKGIIEITHDDAYRCMSPNPINAQNLYKVICPDGEYSSLQAYLNCHCDGTNLKANIDSNCK